MKKIFYLLFVFAAVFLLQENSFWHSTVSAQVKDRQQIIQPEAQNEREKDLQLAAQIRRLTNHTTNGLTERARRNGEVSIDLSSGFQNIMLSKIDDDGEPAAACITSIGEANAFFGRNLETGEPVFSTDYKTKNDPTEQLAAQSGMSKLEYEFYTNLIVKATQSSNATLSTTGATITISNADGAGEGFNDPTARAPEGGNSGATLGEQRINLFNYAAGIWGAYLDSSVPIVVKAQFDPLTPCSSTGGTLGSAGTTSISRDFPNAPYPNTWYHTALAAKLSGADRNGASPEINATFNSSVDTGCLNGRTFYYGLDNVTPSGKINLLAVLLHELGHGLGFSSFVDGATGQNAGSDTNGRFPDIFSRFLYDRTTGKYWYQMTDAERLASGFNSGNVLWDGANVKIASGFLTSGREVSTGRVQIFAPDPYKDGSSISHWDSACFPNLLMEPNITSGLPLTLDLTRQEMRDIGWYRDTTLDLVPDAIINVQPSGGNFIVGSSATVTWTNTGGFNRNVTVEISTDGGATYTVLASNIANTGSYTFTVPNTITGQAVVRVREYDFIEPLGVSAANFTIGAQATPTPTPTPTPIPTPIPTPTSSRNNYALASSGSVATASSADGRYPASFAINGDRPGTNLGLWVSGAGLPQWLEVNFGQVRTIDEIDVITVQDNYQSPTEPTLTTTFTRTYGNTAFEVQYWNGSGWVNIASVTGNNKVWRQFTFAATTTTKIRVNVTGSADNYAYLTEVEAWGQ